MRTTITLEPDVSERVREHMRKTGKGLKQSINELIRKGLAPAPPQKCPFVVRARALGLRPGISLDDVEALLDQIDGVYRS